MGNKPSGTFCADTTAVIKNAAMAAVGRNVVNSYFFRYPRT